MGLMVRWKRPAPGFSSVGPAVALGAVLVHRAEHGAPRQGGPGERGASARAHLRGATGGATQIQSSRIHPSSETETAAAAPGARRSADPRSSFVPSQKSPFGILPVTRVPRTRGGSSPVDVTGPG